MKNANIEKLAYYIISHIAKKFNRLKKRRCVLYIHVTNIQTQ